MKINRLFIVLVISLFVMAAAVLTGHAQDTSPGWYYYNSSTFSPNNGALGPSANYAGAETFTSAQDEAASVNLGPVTLQQLVYSTPVALVAWADNGDGTQDGLILLSINGVWSWGLYNGSQVSASEFSTAQAALDDANLNAPYSPFLAPETTGQNNEMPSITNSPLAAASVAANGFTSIFDGSITIWVALGGVLFAILVVLGIFMPQKRKGVK